MRRALPYVVAFVVYVALGLLLRTFVLNWILGPLWLMLVLDVIPRALGIGPIGDDDWPTDT